MKTLLILSILLFGVFSQPLMAQDLTTEVLSMKIATITDGCLSALSGYDAILQDLYYNRTRLEVALANVRLQVRMIEEKRDFFERVNTSMNNVVEFIFNNDIPTSFGTVSIPLEAADDYGATSTSLIQLRPNDEWPLKLTVE